MTALPVDVIAERLGGGERARSIARTALEALDAGGFLVLPSPELRDQLRRASMYPGVDHGGE